ncbi:E3 ubiquitin-protein ligase MIB2-like [Littorina saxatilis]|uniref:E3 ubiquitin-protein ligase MIB2-like n=1 Tax=Littorina saxatilis TaxID=31220 RepID=UPI0038B67C41
MLAGLRVIRGPGWKQGDADGGEGHVGTVVGAEDDGTVEVTWDGGQVSKVKAGTNEVLVLDNATVGVRHADHTCDECQESGIVGLRWRCTQCEDYDLCSLCYFGDTHDCGHQFDRYETSKSKPERMEKRNKSTKIRVMGIYPDATVTRGRDWEWSDQDGGPGSEGHVLDIITPATNSARSTVKVEWTGNKFKNVYRVGFKGKVDLQYSEEAPGGECYPHHLPILDPKNYTVTSSASSDAVGDVGIAEGDRVVITVGADKLQELQKSRSGWAVGMTRCVGKVGEVKGFAANGDAIVGFGPKKYRLVPQALKKVANISTGDHVRVIEDDNKVKVFQDGHGGFNDDMKSSLGKVGEVIKMDSDGDVVVQFGQQKWLFNPACLTPAPGAKLDTIVVEPSARSRPSFDRAESSLGALNQLLGAVFLKAAMEAQASMPQKLMIKAVLENDITGVKRLVDKDKALVHAEEQGVSALHLAANQGNLQITQILVENGAKLDGRDSDGDSPLMAEYRAPCGGIKHRGHKQGQGEGRLGGHETT